MTLWYRIPLLAACLGCLPTPARDNPTDPVLRDHVAVQAAVLLDGEPIQASVVEWLRPIYLTAPESTAVNGHPLTVRWFGCARSVCAAADWVDLRPGESFAPTDSVEVTPEPAEFVYLNPERDFGQTPFWVRGVFQNTFSGLASEATTRIAVVNHPPAIAMEELYLSDPTPQVAISPSIADSTHRGPFEVEVLQSANNLSSCPDLQGECDSDQCALTGPDDNGAGATCAYEVIATDAGGATGRTQFELRFSPSQTGTSSETGTTTN